MRIHNLDVDRNLTAVRLKMNRVSNHLVCRGNNRVQGFGNRAAGGMRHQCASLR
jgi:hypothetical protein